MSDKLRVGFLHPEMGIGGAEQLVINFMSALTQKGHSTTLYTGKFDPSSSFSALSDGSLPMKVIGGWIPSTFLKRFKALLAYIKMVYISIYVLLFEPRKDVYVVDQVSFIVPLLRLSRARIVFYCHFPDKAQCSDRGSILRRIYRAPLDFLEETSTGASDLILVNSRFTKAAFFSNFPKLKARNLDPQVLYPPTDFKAFAQPSDAPLVWAPNRFFLSLNRFERKKNVQLALKAFHRFKKANPEASEKLVVAGGLNPSSPDSVACYQELNSLTKKLSIQNDVVFRTNLSEEERLSVLARAVAVLYTPHGEHFGIVPVESMFLQTPVIACSDGGPTESVLHEQTGFLLDEDLQVWAERMKILASDAPLRLKFGQRGKEHVQNLFGIEKFADDAQKLFAGLLKEQTKKLR